MESNWGLKTRGPFKKDELILVLNKVREEIVSSLSGNSPPYWKEIHLGICLFHGIGRVCHLFTPGRRSIHIISSVECNWMSNFVAAVRLLLLP
jgi:hypothetical protein